MSWSLMSSLHALHLLTFQIVSLIPLVIVTAISFLNALLHMYIKSLWIKASVKRINVNVML